jgi:signal transduction histidine kinase
MENSQIEATLDKALETFRHAPETPETGLDVDDPALLQLRKACRLLDAAEFLEAANGYYTLVIEASFAVIERTLQSYLLQKDIIHDDDFVTHEQVYDLGEQAGLYNKDVRDKLLGLWQNNRSRTYYREGIGSEQSAAHMTTLARDIHDHVLQLAGNAHQCICGSK